MFAVAIGVLVMTAILAGTPMYLGTIESLGLRSTLATISPVHRNIQVVVERLPLTERSTSAASERVEKALEELGDLVVGIGQESHTRDHYWSDDPLQLVGGPAADVAVLQRFQGFLEHVEIVDGRIPATFVQQDEGFAVAEVVVPRGRAEQLGVEIGDELWLTPSPSDPPYLLVKVAGFFEPRNLTDEFWLGLGPEVLEPGRPGPAARFRLPLFFVEDVLFEALAGGPASIGTNRWLVRLDLDQLERQSPSSTANQVEAVGHQLRRGLPESVAVSALENRVRSLGDKISFARIPTLMMGGVLLLAAGYYSIMAVGALTARRRVDTARLWARGSGGRLLSLMFIYEAVILVIVPALSAPFLALVVITLVGQLPEYELITLGAGMPVFLTWQAFAWSLAGAALVLAYIFWTVLRDSGRQIGSEQISSRRVEGKPFYQRQYLDLVFFLFGGVVLWDLSTETSVVTEGTGGSIAVNPLLVFAPAIFLGVAVLFSLRILPPLARLISGGFGRRGPAWTHLISALFARVPITYAWPMAILGMAAGTAMLSATVAATLEQGAFDQSGYEVGADLRLFPVDLNSGPRTAVLDDVRAITGVREMSLGLRTIGSKRIGGQGVPFEFLAIEPAEFAGIGIFRSDFAASPQEILLSKLERNNQLPALGVPESATRVGFRMRSDVAVENMRASMRLLDATGLAFNVDLGATNNIDWQVRMGEVSRKAARPVEIVGLTFFELTPDELGSPATILIDYMVYDESSVTTSVGSGETVTGQYVPEQVLESFDIPGEWHPLASSRGTDTSVGSFEFLSDIDSEGNKGHALQIDLGIGTDRGVRGVVRGSSTVVPVLFSQSALVSNDLAVGESTVIHVFDRSIPVSIVGVVDYFPTLDPAAGGFVVADADQLWDHLTLSSANSAGVAAEVFVGLSDPTDLGVIDRVSSEIDGLHSVVNRENIQESSVVTPLAVAGWRGASVVTAILAVLLALLGFLTFIPMRPASDQFVLGVLRALGLRRRGLLAINLVEHLVVLSVGVGAGIGSGMVMARLAVDTASQTDATVNRLPPLDFSTNWNFVGALVISLVLAAAVAVVIDLISMRKIDVAGITRATGKSG